MTPEQGVIQKSDNPGNYGDIGNIEDVPLKSEGVK